MQTWNLIRSGYTCGVFQCESQLVQSWLRKIRPQNIWELSAVISLVRPGPLRSGYAEQYVANKNQPDSIESFGNNIIDEIFTSTNGVACIEENTKIQLCNGTTKSIKDILVLDKIKSLDVENNLVEDDYCINIIKSNKTDGVKLTLSNNKEIIITKDHKILTLNGWKNILQIDIEEDYIACPNNIRIDNINDKIDNLNLGSNLHIAYLLGLLIGDGSCKNSSIVLSCGSEQNCDIIKQWIETNTNIGCVKYHHTRCWYLRLKSDYCDGKLTKLRSLLRSVDLDQKTCYNKYICNEILSSTLEFQKSVLAGLFDSDGHISKTGFHITSVSQNLLNGISQLLTNIGICHKLSDNRVYIIDGIKFNQLINPYLILKKDKNYSNHNGLVYHTLPRSILNKYCNNQNISLKKLSKNIQYTGIYKKYSNITKRVYNRLGINFNDIDFYKIIKIEEKSNCNFYDITTKYNSNFIANGIIVHNCYQEQLMQLGSRLAWPHLEENPRLIKVDALRKAVGKKNQEKILEIGKEFVEGCLHNEVPQEIADKLFELIKNSGRYAFNLSHSIKYARIGYQTAFLKAHYPYEFYCAYLSYAKHKLDKWEEINNLVQESKINNIDICSPNINIKNSDFIILNDKIYYGLSHLKFGISEKDLAKVTFNQIKTIKDFVDICFTDKFGIKLRSNSAESLISVGAFQDVCKVRANLLAVYKMLSILSNKEFNIVYNQIFDNTTLEDIQKIIIVNINDFMSKRRNKILSALEFCEFKQSDHPEWIQNKEHDILGVPITAIALDNKMIITSDRCIDCVSTNYKLYEKKELSVTLKTVIETVTKKGENPGQKMARIFVADSTAELQLPVFPEQYTIYSHLLRERNNVLLKVYLGKNGWVVNDITQL